MSATIALMQESLDPPPVDSLQRAFRSGRTVVPADAWTVAKDAFGILVKRLPPDEAASLQSALAAEGVMTVAVPESNLPQLPAVKFVRQVDCLAESFCVYDPIGKKIPIPWNQLLLAAGGAVDHFELPPQPPAESPAEGSLIPDQLKRLWGMESRSRDRVGRESAGRAVVLEIVLIGAVMRFQMRADKLRFNYLEGRATKDPVRNLGLMVEDIVRFGPQVRLNRGAEALRSEPPGLQVYPSKNAFYEEIIWMLWNQSRGH